MHSRIAVLALTLLAAALPAAASAAEFAPLSTIGSLGEGAGQFTGGDIAIGSSGDLYVSDEENFRVDQFAPDGTFVRAVGANVDPAGGNVCTQASGCRKGTTGTGAGEFEAPEGIATGPDGSVYVADGTRGIDVFTADLQFVRFFGSTGAGAGQMNTPFGLAVDPASGDLFVSDVFNHRVDVFDPSGNFVRAFGEDVNVSDSSDVCTASSGCKAGTPSGAAGAINRGLDLAIPAAGGDVYVADAFNERVDEFTTAGEFVRAFGKEVNLTIPADICTTNVGCKTGQKSAAAGGFEVPEYVGFDSTGNLYVSDTENRRVAVYSASGVFQHAFSDGVIDGAEEFQVCTAETGCMKGLNKPGLGSVERPTGIAAGEGCASPGIYVMGAGFPSTVRITRFGEPGSAAPASCSAKPEERKPPSNRITLGALKLNKKRGTALLAIKVPGPGALALSGKGVRGQRLHVPGVTTVNLPVVLGGKAKKKLVKTGKAKVKVTVAFTPDGATEAGHASKSVTLKKQTKKEKR